MIEKTNVDKPAEIIVGMILANAMTVNLLCSKDLLSRDEAAEYFKTMSDALLKNNFSVNSTYAIDVISRWVLFLHLPPHEFSQKLNGLLHDLRAAED